MDELQQFVDEIMHSFQAPYSEDIIDEVFCTIQSNPRWMNKYMSFLKDRSKHFVNPQIGRLVKEYTGLSTLSFPNKPNSDLIESYSKLGNDYSKR